MEDFMGVYIEFDKPFKTYDEQIDYLRTHYHLMIPDRNFARDVLSTISYYDLINGYQDCMMYDGIFKNKVSPEYLIHFYSFDKSFQNVLLKNSLLVENIFKTKLAYVIAENFGISMYDYLRPQNFKNNYRRNIYFYKVKKDIDNRLERFKPLPTQYYIEKHHHVPPWILLKNVEFGNAINLYKLLKAPQKEAVATSMLSFINASKNDKINFLTSALGLIKEYRNVIAHNLKFITYTSSKNMLPLQTTFNILPYPILTNGIKSFDNIYAYILAVTILLQLPLLRARFCYDLTNIFLETHNGERLQVLDRIAADYINIIELPIDFNQRLEWILRNWQKLSEPK